jgi:hypothetical protein
MNNINQSPVKYFLFDITAPGIVICCTMVPSYINSLLAGNMNFTSNMITLDSARDYNFNDTSVNYRYISSTNKFEVLETQFTPIGFAEYRQLILNRLDALQRLDQNAKSVTYRLHDFYGSTDFIAVLSHELLNCDPNTNKYSDAIKEWARIQEIPAETAYKELSMKFEDTALQYLRNHAIYTKYARKINQSTTPEDLRNVLSSALMEFKLDSFL